jgi:AGCS family alanine or glycine:cation symporter
MYLGITLLEEFLRKTNIVLWDGPIVGLIFFVGVICTLLFRGLQFSYFFKAWNWIFSRDPDAVIDSTEKSITPIQAFINALSTSMGNGGLAGMAVVFVDGGLGAAFWVFFLGCIGMVVRFVEVYASMKMSTKEYFGPLGYIVKLPFGKFFCLLYSVILIFYGLFAAIVLQVNSIGLTLQKSFHLSPYIIAIGFALFIAYVVFGGSKRIMRLAELVIPLKVGLFFLGIFLLLFYHSHNILPVLQEALRSAFTVDACFKGVACYSVQRMIAIAWSKAANATEMGMGLAGIFFSSTEAKKPFRTAIMSMISSFISTNLVCVLIILSLGVSGASRAGDVTSTALIIDAFSTVLGSWAGPFIVFLTFTFGLGVMIAYIFSGIKLWEGVFSKKTSFIYQLLAILLGGLGAFISVKFLFDLLDVFAAMIVSINLFGLLWSIKYIYSEYKKDSLITK